MIRTAVCVTLLICLMCDNSLGAGDLRGRYRGIMKAFDQDRNGNLTAIDFELWTYAVGKGHKSSATKKACDETIELVHGFFKKFPNPRNMSIEDVVDKYEELQCAGLLGSMYGAYRGKLFACFDENSDGKLSSAEFKVLAEAYYYRRNSDDIFKYLDKDNDKSITAEEYVKSYVDYFTNASIKDSDVWVLKGAY